MGKLINDKEIQEKPFKTLLSIPIREEKEFIETLKRYSLVGIDLDYLADRDCDPILLYDPHYYNIGGKRYISYPQCSIEDMKGFSLGYLSFDTLQIKEAG